MKRGQARPPFCLSPPPSPQLPVCLAAGHGHMTTFCPPGWDTPLGPSKPPARYPPGEGKAILQRRRQKPLGGAGPGPEPIAPASRGRLLGPSHRLCRGLLATAVPAPHTEAAWPVHTANQRARALARKQVHTPPPTKGGDSDRWLVPNISLPDTRKRSAGSEERPAGQARGLGAGRRFQKLPPGNKPCRVARPGLALTSRKPRGLRWVTVKCHCPPHVPWVDVDSRRWLRGTFSVAGGVPARSRAVTHLPRPPAPPTCTAASCLPCAGRRADGLASPSRRGRTQACEGHVGSSEPSHGLRDPSSLPDLAP